MQYSLKVRIIKVSVLIVSFITMLGRYRVASVSFNVRGDITGIECELP